MKIVLFIYAMHKSGGTERVAANLANSLVKQGNDVSIICVVNNGLGSFYQLEDNVKLINSDLLGKNFNLIQKLLYTPKTIFIFRKLILNEKPDLVISFCDKINILVTLSLLLKKIPLIVTEHFTPGYYKIGRVWDVLREIAYRKAEYVTVLTEDSRSYFTQAIQNKIVVVPNIVPCPEAIKDFNQENRVIVAVGRLKSVKGFDILIKAFAEVNEHYPNWNLNIWGIGEEKEKLQNLIELLKLDKSVSLKGETNNVYNEMSKSDIFVLSSRLEPFGMVICEAMSVGLAVVSTDCPSGPRTIITNGHDGILVENENAEAMSNAIIDLIRDKNKRINVGYNAMQSIKRYSEENIIKQWSNLIELAIKRQNN